MRTNRDVIQLMPRHASEVACASHVGVPRVRSRGSEQAIKARLLRIRSDMRPPSDRRGQRGALGARHKIVLIMDRTC